MVKVHIVKYSVIKGKFIFLTFSKKFSGQFLSNLLCVTLRIRTLRVVKIGGLGLTGVCQEGKFVSSLSTSFTPKSIEITAILTDSLFKILGTRFV